MNPENHKQTVRPTDIEMWAIQVVDRVKSGAAVEDSRVELKRDWPDPDRAARRIAGHANAVRGEPILWLIGVDEKHGVLGADPNNLANWFPAVSSCFDGAAPSLQEVAFVYDGKEVMALLFDTSRIPFVVKNPKGGEISREVPWREGTAIRTASREELLRLFTPLRRKPKIEIRNVHISSYSGGGGTTVSVSLYVVPIDDSILTFPFHKCSIIVVCPDGSEIDRLGFYAASKNPNRSMIQAAPSQAIVSHPDMLEISAGHSQAKAPDCPELRIKGSLHEIVGDSLLTFECIVPLKEKNPHCSTWVYDAATIKRG
jgi:hypothetical protein